MGLFTKLLDYFNLDNMKERSKKEPSSTINSNHQNKHGVYDSVASHYKMDTIEDIESIPVPTKPYTYSCDWKESIEYVLQRKATEHKRNGNIDIAIACLKKVIELMPYAPMQYPEVYSRLENYLKIARNFNEAHEAHSLAENKGAQYYTDITNMYLNIADDYEMIYVPREPTICANCACFHDRVYSKNPNDGYPDISIFTNYISKRTCNCHLMANPLFPDFNNISADYPLSHSTRPFIDDRTPEEKKRYEDMVIRKSAEKKDRQDYDWLLEHLPNDAPKSYGGYRNMKNRNSSNYQRLVILARQYGYKI